MRVLHLSTFDRLGGAARTMLELCASLREIGIDAEALVQQKSVSEEWVREHRGLIPPSKAGYLQMADTWPLWFYRNKTAMHWSCGRIGARVTREFQSAKPDITHLHWTGRGFLGVREIASLPGPIVWTLHDSWAFTGGCHVPYDCTRYRERCGACPQLGSTHDADITRRTWALKQKKWAASKFTLACPSHWLASAARSSTLMRDQRIEVIPNGVDAQTFRPVSPAEARSKLDLNPETPYILFGAMHAAVDQNKGLHLLFEAIARTPKLNALGAELLVFGVHRVEALDTCPIPVRSMGIVEDSEKLAQIYSAADVMAVPSMLENFPNTILESMACGTPVVAFSAGGIPDIIDHRENGFLADPYSTEQFVLGLQELLANSSAFGQAARRKIESALTRQRMAARYSALYQELVSQ